MHVCECLMSNEGLQEYISIHKQERRGAIKGKQMKQEEIKSRIERSKEVRRES